MRMEPSPPPRMMLPPTENSAAAPVAADAVGAISSAFFSCSLNAARWTDAPVTYLTKITLSHLGHAMRSGNSWCKIAKPDTANHWRALASYLPGKGEDAFRDYGVTAAILPLRRPLHSLTWQWRRRRLKRAMRARVSLTKHEKQWTTDGGRRTDADPQSTPNFYGSFPCGVRGPLLDRAAALRLGGGALDFAIKGCCC